MSALHGVIKRFHEGFRYFLIKKNGTCIYLGERNFVLYRYVPSWNSLANEISKLI